MRTEEVGFSAPFTEEQFGALRGCAEERWFQSSSVILHEGETGDTFYLVLDGEVEVEKRVRDDTSEVRRLSTGALFGEAILIERGEPRSATVRARTDVTVLEFSGPGVLAECDKDRDLAAKLYRLLCRVLRGYLGSTTAALAEAKVELRATAAKEDDELWHMVAAFKARRPPGAAPRA